MATQATPRWLLSTRQVATASGETTAHQWQRGSAEIITATRYGIVWSLGSTLSFAASTRERMLLLADVAYRLGCMVRVDVLVQAWDVHTGMRDRK